MFDCREERRVSITILNVKIEFEIINQMFDDIDVTSGDCEMNCDFALALLELVKHLL